MVDLHAIRKHIPDLGAMKQLWKTKGRAAAGFLTMLKVYHLTNHRQVIYGQINELKAIEVRS